MFTDGDMQAYIHDFFVDLGSFQEFQKEWLVQSISATIADPKGDDPDKYILFKYTSIKRHVDKYLRKWKKSADTDARNVQLSFEGFNHLQVAYSINRNDAVMVVPVERMSDEEIDEKIAEHMKAGGGNYGHAFELQRYKDERKLAAGQASLDALMADLSGEEPIHTNSKGLDGA